MAYQPDASATENFVNRSSFANAVGVKSYGRRTTIPFVQNTAYDFNRAGVSLVLEVGGVYGLAQPLLTRPGWYTILYVGKSGNLRERLQSHLNSPPVAGITHFFVERVDGELARALREQSLIAEFQPIGNTLLK